MTTRLPTKLPNQLGWTFKIQASPATTADVMRIEIDFATTIGPTTADQSFLIQMIPQASGHSPPQNAMIVSLPIEIPQGTQQVKYVRHAPKASFGNLYQVELLQDGRPLPDCEATIGESITYKDATLYENMNQQNKLSLLWVNHDADAESRTKSLQHISLSPEFSLFYSAETPADWDERATKVDFDKNSIHVDDIESENLPNEWLAYRPYDAVVIHRNDYEVLLEGNAPNSRGFRSWIQAGGTVIVRGGSEADPEKRITRTQASEVGSVPSMDAMRAANDGYKTMATDFRLYHEPNNREFESEIQYLNFSEDQVRQWKEWFPIGADFVEDSLKAYPTTRVIEAGGVRAENQLAGTVIHLGKQAPDAPVHLLQWSAAKYLMGWKRHRLIRSGVDPILGSSRFFQWVIPGVSQPPVYTFMGLLGIFVIAVGPIAYRRTAKSGRSYLMFAIAPVLAIATTLAMLVYGVIADGFGTQTRIRQISWVDGESGDAFTRTRSTYFAGIRPSEGLSFPTDADVTVYPDNQQRSWESRVDDRFQPQGEVVVTEDVLKFTQDFLPSRQQKQFVIHRPRPKLGRIVVEANAPTSGEDSSTIRIRNEFAQAVTEILICDGQGKYFFAEKAEPDQSVTGTTLTDKEASERLGEMYKRQWLISSVVDRRQNRTNSMRSSNGETFDLLSSQVNQLDTVAKPTDGIFEFELQMRMQLGSKLPNNSFLCLTDLTEDAIAVTGALPTESIHFVMGSLP